MDTAVIAFARAPELGKVKTRLAAGVGQQHALTVYKACAGHVLQQIARCVMNSFSWCQWQDMLHKVSHRSRLTMQSCDQVQNSHLAQSGFDKSMHAKCSCGLNPICCHPNVEDEGAVKAWLSSINVVRTCLRFSACKITGSST